MNNYSIQEMKISNFYYNRRTSLRGGGNQSITVIGYIGKERVYFSRFDKEIGKLHNLYPQVFLDNEKDYEIKILKFEHSPKVMLVDDDEFQRWKRNLLLSFSYIILSIIIMLLINHKKK